MAPLYRKKPVVVEALQYDGANHEALKNFMGTLRVHPIHENPVIGTLEGDMLVATGDFVIKGVKGEFYPCKPDIFAATYEEVR
jgi:hypothetical protein